MDLLRHGAVEGGVKYRGRTDDPLTAEGYHQMQRVWANISNDIELIITSPLSRCAEPARAWAAERGIECIEEPAVMEMHYGAWEGKSIPEIEAEYPELIKAWRANPDGMQPPGGESTETFRERLIEWQQRCIEAHHGKHILLITHSGVMRMLIALALAAPVATTRRLAMPYACHSRIHHEEGGATLLMHAH